VSDTTSSGANRLIHETSPYLLQHAHNPVDWFAWGDEAFSAARERGVPILLSVGYSACHWCHVMERESFADTATADLMNGSFVCVKVDREERPDVDALYMHATQAMSGHGGWPMTVFLTPEGRPFYAGTYFPPEPRHGMPAFRQVLASVADAWRDRRALIEAQAEGIADDLRRALERQTPPDALTGAITSQAVTVLERYFDRHNGGFGGAPKFPQPMVLDFLLRHGSRTNRTTATEMALRTLGAMASGGIMDHVGGGFHRYAVDDRWLVPHFEKMLYDNAQLATAYLRAWRLTGDDRWLGVATRTLDFVRTEMTLPSGGFISSFDADSDGEEGLYYTWTPDEAAVVLGDESSRACAALGITAEGHVDGRSVVHLPEGAAEASSEWLKVMAQARRGRARPGADRKVIAFWNGMMLSAFAEAAMLTGRADYLQTAVNNGEFILRELCQTGADGTLRLLRSGIEVAHESGHHPPAPERTFRASGIGGFLEDYALVADALLDLHAADGDPRWLAAARSLANAMLTRFSSGGALLRGAAPDECALFANPCPTEDNATPSGNAVAAGLCLRLAALPGEGAETFANWSARALRAMAQDLSRHPLAFGRWLCAAETALAGATCVVVTGAFDDPRTEELLAAARRSFRPDMLIVASDETGGDDYPTISGTPAAYVCTNRACRLPATTPEELTKELASPRWA